MMLAQIRFDKNDVKREAQKLHPDIKIRKLFKKYENVFSAELPKGMPLEREVNYEILLNTDILVPARGMHRLSVAELDELHKQIE